MAWTERHSVAATALAAAGAAGVLGAGAPGALPLVVLAAVLVTAVAALALDAFGGLVVGLAAAAAVTLAKQLGRAWTPDVFGESLATTAVLLLLGWSCGRLGRRLRQPPADPGAPRGEEPAFGSLGLLTAEVAETRIDEEVARAGRHGRPLAVILVRTVLTDDALGPAARTKAHRTVARFLETLLGESDVPFALAADCVGAVLLETDADGAWDVLASILHSAADATFSDREGGRRLRLAETADVAAGIAVFPEDGADARSLIDSARRALEADAGHTPGAGAPQDPR
ncbi:GGDEF domain-containing protein [Kineococcus xinjiangensis]|uniref:GGDEF domain-containing protein n=1 Tax=Kineococcus xinjiangensis TaxID=512762 RepID=A0A2S6IMC8_9ACTN|nr:hypothetical protein [Kineococcus xinjiangensis]PPK95383.1 GGDEF domain-containing protein [Kineococcus xinjiangensis]